MVRGVRQRIPRTAATALAVGLVGAMISPLTNAALAASTTAPTLQRPAVTTLTDAPSEPEPDTPTTDPGTGPSSPQPSEPEAPGTDEPTDPSVPTEPVDPTEPGVPTEPGEPTEPGTPTDPSTPTDPATPTPSAPGETPDVENGPTPTGPGAYGQYDLGNVDWVTGDDVTGAQGDPRELDALAAEARAQLKFIDDALKDAKERVDKAGEAYKTARDKANQAQAELDELEAKIERQKNRASVSDAVVNQMVQRMRQGSYAVPPQVNVLLDPASGDDMLYRYGVLANLSEEEFRTAESAREAAAELETLIPAAEQKKREADELEAEAEEVKRDAVDTQRWLDNQLEAAETNSAALATVLDELGYDGEIGSAQLDDLIAVRRQLQALEPGEVREGQFAHPMPGGRVTSYYGPRVHPVTGGPDMHWGVDFVNGNTCGTPLYAMAEGTVTYAGSLGGYGGHLEVTMPDGNRYSYSHIQNNGYGVRVGEKVKPGQPIALAGTTGMSTGCHLHLEVRAGGGFVNPLDWMVARGLTGA